MSKFDIRPSVLLTVLLGFTKDPYPYIRNVALNGLADFCKCIVVEDESLIKGCCFRAVELLSDSEDSVRCSAVRAVRFPNDRAYYHLKCMYYLYLSRKGIENLVLKNPNCLLLV